jgi:predicted lipoprotein with Yx(FWY)xxD motif
MKTTFAFISVLLAASAAQAAPAIDQGGVLADKAGRTLYTFAKDAPGKSACNGACAAAWPPFAASNQAQASGDFSVVVRDDGSRQWAFRNQPLYFYAGDARPGDLRGEGQGGAWFTVKSKASDKQAAAQEDAGRATGTYSSYSYSY